MSAAKSCPTLAELNKLKHAPSSIFAEHPAIGTATVEGLACAVPYHNYDADALIIWGAADPSWVQARLRGPWRPLLDKDGRALVSLWVVDYKDTVINPYKELIIAFSVVHTSKPDPGRVTSPHQQLQLFDDKQASPYIYKLWLDQQLPITYGRDLLGCDKYLDEKMGLQFDGPNATFEFRHVEGELHVAGAGPLLKGSLKLREGTHLRQLIGAYGLTRTLGMALGASGKWHVVNPPGVMARPDTASVNPVWTFAYETTPKFTSARDSDDLVYGGELADMGFKASLYQHDAHLKGVLLPPWSFTPVERTSSRA
eukprot:CAMPEP_0119300808 /NCGR_PEP_ID=MMETSP1333-20130426/2705_1 /TAXON_ID=418940 /ORGANISM="Scyphosphaera apsteinii, Strain RCC1455" /LENGTH=311 /DNA_ID=CAMNT_0007302709 /DNA_START=42 /DNA_END=977 /DNA_ORIENTATION=-